MAMMGTPDGPPVRFGVAMVDIATGMVLVSGVLAALLDRGRTGRGRLLEFPLYATAFSCLGTVIASASVDPASQGGRWGSGHPSIVPYSAFEAADGFVVIGAINDLMWERLCEALGLDDLRARPARGDQRGPGRQPRPRRRTRSPRRSPAARRRTSPRGSSAPACWSPRCAPPATAVDGPAGRRARRWSTSSTASSLTRTPLEPVQPARACRPHSGWARTPPPCSAERLGLGADELRELAAAGVVETAGEAEGQAVGRRLSRRPGSGAVEPLGPALLPEDERERRRPRPRTASSRAR